MIASDIQWWCSARGERWTWAWRAYPGVWIAMVALGAWIWHRQRPSAATLGASTEAPVATGADRWLGISAIVLLWITLDWPVGPLGAGYLASVHTLQFVSLAIVAPPLLLLAVRHSIRARYDARHADGRGAWWDSLTHPVVAGVLFSAVMGATHAPRVVDTLMKQQLGSFALDAAWFGAGVLFWWPVIAQRPQRAWFGPLLRMLYLFFGTQAHLGIAMWLLIAQFPVYATYELAPRVTSISALDDQQIAGGIMISIVEPLVLGAISVLFFRWFRASEAEAAALDRSRLAVPPFPESRP